MHYRPDALSVIVLNTSAEINELLASQGAVHVGVYTRVRARLYIEQWLVERRIDIVGGAFSLVRLLRLVQFHRKLPLRDHHVGVDPWSGPNHLQLEAITRRTPIGEGL